MADYDFVVIGSGPGGYPSAIRAAQLGLRTAVIERDELGGVCLNWGCIPSKALLRNAEVLSLFQRAADFGITCENLTADFGSAIARSREVVGRLTKGVGGLFRKNKVEHIQGTGSLRDATTIEIKETGQVISAKHIVIATGARARSLPHLPIDGSLVMTSREALESNDLPESALIVGGGATGCEFAYLYNAYGVKVTIVELLPHLLPNEDEEVSQQLERAFRKQGITVLTDTKVTEMTAGTKTAKVTMEGPEGSTTSEYHRLLVAVGVQANIEGLELEKVGVGTEKGFIAVDDHMLTSVQSISAIGDVTGVMLLAHVATAQGVAVAEWQAGQDSPTIDYDIMPKAVYCQPQVASWGLTEEQAQAQGHQTQVGRFPFSANGKALGLGDSEGFVKTIIDAEYGEILGVHMIGPEVTELLAELSMARMLEGTAQEVGWLVHAHPTLSEVVKESALAARGEAIHM